MAIEHNWLIGAGVSAPLDMALPAIPEQLVARHSDDAGLAANIGRRGIRFKDRATRLALVSARRAMEAAGLVASGYSDLDDRRCAIVVASRFGNVDTVLRCAAQLRAGGAASLSPMDLPNASANVIPSTLAIWFGLRGPNLLVAGGRDCGLQALKTSLVLLDSHQADRVLVCGVEAGQPELEPLFLSAAAGETAPVDVSAALVLERAADVPGAGWALARARDGRAPSAPAVVRPGSGQPPLMLGQSDAPGPYHGAHGASGVLEAIARTRCDLETSASARGLAGVLP